MYDQYHTISRYIATWLLLQNSHFIHLVMECCMMFYCVGAGNDVLLQTVLPTPIVFCQEVVVAVWRGPSPPEIVVHDLVHKVDKLQDT